MSSRILRVIVIIVLGTGCFFMGYYNEAICTFFFNKDAMIGLLSVSLMGTIFYSQSLKGKLSYSRYNSEIVSNELSDMRTKYYNRKDIKKIVEDSKDEIIVKMESLYKQAKQK